MSLSETLPDTESDRLDLLARGHVATIESVAWDTLRPNEARRMRELGFDEGVAVEKLHAAPFGQDPIAIRVGRMTIAIRRSQAAAVRVRIAGTGAPAVAATGRYDGLAVAAE